MKFIRYFRIVISRILVGIFAIFFAAHHANAATLISAATLFPAQEYTRITLESNQALVYKVMEIKNPDRIVLDIENSVLNAALKSLTEKPLVNDPYIKQIRVANFQQNVVRIVLDLKTQVQAKAYNYSPDGSFQHRLMLDILPKDALMNMLATREATANQSTTTQVNTPAANKPVPDEMKTDTNHQEQIIYEPLPTLPTGEKQAPDKNINFPPETEIPVMNKEGKSSNVKSKVSNKNERNIVIAIDAGHGGEDPGARGANGSHEKDITLMIAKKLKDAIDNEPNMQGVLTRDDDFFIPLHGRVVRARNAQADLFVSIHADAFINTDARGSSVFALSERGATSASARYLAKKENESDLIGGVSLDDKDPNLARTLLDLSQTATINDSLKLGKAVLGQIGKINRLHKGSVEQAGFAVLKSPDIPSILVETAFISNPEEERKLNDEAYQDKLVNSILMGIKKYFSTNPALAKNKLSK